LTTSPGLAAAKSAVRLHTIFGVCFVAMYDLYAVPSGFFILIKTPGVFAVELITPI
jgi:hypothetical protein